MWTNKTIRLDALTVQPVSSQRSATLATKDPTM